MKKEQKKFVYLNFDTHRSIKLLAVQNNMNLQDLIDQILNEWLKNNQ